jgi:hypothetical protein
LEIEKTNILERYQSINYASRKGEERYEELKTISPLLQIILMHLDKN